MCYFNLEKNLLFIFSGSFESHHEGDVCQPTNHFPVAGGVCDTNTICDGRAHLSKSSCRQPG